MGNLFEICRMGTSLNTTSLDRLSAVRGNMIERRSASSRTTITPTPMEDSIVSTRNIRNGHSSISQDSGSRSITGISHNLVSGQLPDGRQVTTSVTGSSIVCQTHCCCCG